MSHEGQTRKPKEVPHTIDEVLRKAMNSAARGGLTGAMGMAVQVVSLMWLRTTMNYQYRHGGSMFSVMRILYAEGGVSRFYWGLLPALIQGPLSRFGDCAANDGALALLGNWHVTRDLPLAVQTGGASIAAGLFRIILMPVDTVKTIMQVEGKRGLPALAAKYKVGGPTVFFHGALGAAGATAVGHYPWFVTYNYLDKTLPVPKEFGYRLVRNASVGLAAGIVSDVASNSIRVLKTYRQTSTVPVSYVTAMRDVVAKDGLKGLFFRGLSTRIVAHGINSAVFTVAWKYLQDEWKRRESQ
eukprot:TRINITY_DN41403_c0_g1_i1.p1 TRINITY_DN41403_c0_g1~~TRINITY_DN41403_c0_g1_i1.p1  ORF type:complete len:314 (-),score=50.37 TRINITY_DN41403_c0_g1_i1:70-966(-)